MAVDIVYETHSLTVDNETGHATGWRDGELSAHGSDRQPGAGTAALEVRGAGRRCPPGRIAHGAGGNADLGRCDVHPRAPSAALGTSAGPPDEEGLIGTLAPANSGVGANSLGADR